MSQWLGGHAPLGSQVCVVPMRALRLGHVLHSEGGRARHLVLCPLARTATSFACRSKF